MCIFNVEMLRHMHPDCYLQMKEDRSQIRGTVTLNLELWKGCNSRKKTVEKVGGR